jgi:hypothetical protein
VNKTDQPITIPEKACIQMLSISGFCRLFWTPIREAVEMAVKIQANFEELGI